MVKSILRFLWLCVQRASRRSIRAADGIYGGIGLVVITVMVGWLGVKLPIPKHTAYAEQIKSAIYFLGILVATWLVRFICAPFVLWREQEEKIRGLEKVDNGDLERMLHGMFIGNVFMYKGDITLCKDFRGKLEISRLRDNYVEIPVHAPKNSWARIKLQFFNSRQTAGEKCHFYFLDARGKPTLIDDIYDDLQVCLDDKAQFSLKLICDDNYVLADEASLRVTIESWAK